MSGWLELSTTQGRYTFREIAISVMALLLAGCAEIDVPTETIKQQPAAVGAPWRTALTEADGIDFICKEEWSYYPGINAWYREGPGEWWYEDPFQSCDGWYDRGWGDEFGDGGDFVAWTEVAPGQNDHYAAVVDELETCPLCRIRDVAVAVGTNPAVREYADEIVEYYVGMGHRLVYEWNRIGPYFYGRLGQIHHVATVKNTISTLNGGLWTPRFAELFRVAGSSVADSRNRVYVVGHTGPHSSQYHQAVYDRLVGALGRGEMDFWDELARIAHECATPGTVMNALCTKQ